MALSSVLVASVSGMCGAGGGSSDGYEISEMLVGDQRYGVGGDNDYRRDYNSLLPGRDGRRWGM